MTSGRTGRADEGRHAPGPGEWWEECWDVEFAAPDGDLGGFVRLAHYPNQRRAWCWVYVLRADGTVVVRDHDVPWSTGPALLARAEALWCELVCETPMEHWSIGVEAFGVRLDDPYDGLRGEIGTRVAVGLELEWEASAEPVAPADRDGYAQFGAVHGDVLLSDELIPFAGDGTRRHMWGDRDWWSRPWEEIRCPGGSPSRASPTLLAVVPLPERDGPTRHTTQIPYVSRALARCDQAGGAHAIGWVESLHTGE